MVKSSLTKPTAASLARSQAIKKQSTKVFQKRGTVSTPKATTVKTATPKSNTPTPAAPIASTNAAPTPNSTPIQPSKAPVQKNIVKKVAVALRKVSTPNGLKKVGAVKVVPQKKAPVAKSPAAAPSKEQAAPVAASTTTPAAAAAPVVPAIKKTQRAAPRAKTPLSARSTTKENIPQTSTSDVPLVKKFKARPLDPRIYSSGAYGQFGVPNYKSRKPTIARSPQLGKKRTESAQPKGKNVLLKKLAESAQLKDITNGASASVDAMEVDAVSAPVAASS